MAVSVVLLALAQMKWPQYGRGGNSALHKSHLGNSSMHCWPRVLDCKHLGAVLVFYERKGPAREQGHGPITKSDRVKVCGSVDTVHTV